MPIIPDFEYIKKCIRQEDMHKAFLKKYPSFEGYFFIFQNSIDIITIIVYNIKERWCTYGKMC